MELMALTHDSSCKAPTALPDTTTPSSSVAKSSTAARVITNLENLFRTSCPRVVL